MRPRAEEADLVVRASKRSGGRPGTDWLPCVAKLLEDVQDLLRITSLILVPRPFQVQIRRGLKYDLTSDRPRV